MNGRTVCVAHGGHSLLHSPYIPHSRHSSLHSVYSEHSVAIIWGPGLLCSLVQVLGGVDQNWCFGVGENPASWSGRTDIKGWSPGQEQPLPVPFDVAKKVNRNFSPLFSRSQPRLPSYLSYLSITLVCLQQVRKAPLNPRYCE